MDADAVELRVLGCLIEKQRTTPDVYPLSLNAQLDGVGVHRPEPTAARPQA